MEQGLRELKLNDLSKDQLVELARELSCDVTSRSSKKDSIAAIERGVLLVKELLIGSST